MAKADGPDHSQPNTLQTHQSNRAKHPLRHSWIMLDQSSAKKLNQIKFKVSNKRTWKITLYDRKIGLRYPFYINIR